MRRILTKVPLKQVETTFETLSRITKGQFSILVFDFAGLIYWNQNRSYKHRANIVLPTDMAGPSTPRRSSSPLSMYTSDIVYPIAEHTDEQQISCMKRSSAHSDDDEDDDDDDYPRSEDDVYGDTEDLDIEQDSSHSPLLAAKHASSSDNNGKVTRGFEVLATVILYRNPRI